MPAFLPELPDLGQLRHQAKELHRAAAGGDPAALERIHAVSDQVTRTTAQLTLAREYEFASWARLKLEVQRKRLLASGDLAGLARLLAAHPALAAERVSSRYQDDPTDTTTVLNYVGVARFHGLADHDRAGEIARLLLAAGAPVDGLPGTPETPLITAASYGETGIVRALVEAGADLEATGFAVEDGSALAHAVEFGNTEAVDVLVGAGAVVHDLVEAAGAGRLGGFLTPQVPAADRARALRAAAVNQRLDIIDALLATGLAADAETGGATALHWAAWHGKTAGVRHLLARAADPDRRDATYTSTPLGWCRHRHAELAGFGAHLTSGHVETERLLEPLTTTT